MKIKPAIVVVAYNRIAPLQRLLNSIAAAVYEVQDITLIISIDKSDTGEIIELAGNFEWRYGEKKIIEHRQHLGLKAHILWCGDLSLQNEAIIVLEDDLIVSPYYYEFSCKACNYYINEQQVAGISLYNYQVAENCFYPFKPIDDGTDVYFMQVASSWGQLWTSLQWQKFKEWFQNNPELPVNAGIPEYLQKWGQHSWKKHFIHYLIAEKKYFVFPRLSLTSNFEEPGTNASSKNVFHVSLQLNKKEYKFQQSEKSKAVYDAWFELEPSVLNSFREDFKPYSYEIDLYGTKGIIPNQYDFVLTSKIAEHTLLNYSMDLFPLETNVILNLSGEGIALCEKRNNKFLPKKLPLKNYIDELGVGKDLSMSLVVPIMEWKEQELRNTLYSIFNQKYLGVEVILVFDKVKLADVERTVSYFKQKIKLIAEENQHSLDELVVKGLLNAENQLVCWVRAGTIFSKDALKQVNSIFYAHTSVNWINGIHEKIKDRQQYDHLNVFKYRLVKGETYRHLQSGKINYTLEGHFYRSGCLTRPIKNKMNLKKIFFHFIDHYQHIVVVLPFFTKAKDPQVTLLSKAEKSNLLKLHRHFKYSSDRRGKLINFIIKTPFIGHYRSANWYYSSLNNFPDVLRYDFESENFFFCKH